MVLQVATAMARLFGYTLGRIFLRRCPAARYLLTMDSIGKTPCAGLRLVRLAGMHERITAECGQVVDWWPPSKYCPECGERGRERSGAEFQHQNRCKDCGHVWSPDTSYLRIRQRKHVVESESMSDVPAAEGDISLR